MVVGKDFIVYSYCDDTRELYVESVEDFVNNWL